MESIESLRNENEYLRRSLMRAEFANTELQKKYAELELQRERLHNEIARLIVLADNAGLDLTDDQRLEVNYEI